MLKGMANAANVPPHYSFRIVDLLVHNPEAREKGCQAGFSAPIFISALRRVSFETDFVPGSASIMKACQHLPEEV
jgi:hypothetical protein